MNNSTQIRTLGMRVVLPFLDSVRFFKLLDGGKMIDIDGTAPGIFFHYFTKHCLKDYWHLLLQLLLFFGAQLLTKQCYWYVFQVFFCIINKYTWRSGNLSLVKYKTLVYGQWLISVKWVNYNAQHISTKTTMPPTCWMCDAKMYTCKIKQTKLWQTKHLLKITYEWKYICWQHKN